MKRIVFWLAALVILTAGCDSRAGSGPVSTLNIDPPSNPYQSTTKTPPAATPTTALPTTMPIIPTPTPFKHAVQPGETLYGIALTYNVSFDRLVDANPDLEARLLSVGTEVIIPLGEEENIPPTPTPYPLLQEQPFCYETAEDGLYCLALVENNQTLSLENISLAFNILNADQELVRSELGFPPLNTLFPGQAIPISVLIKDIEPDQYQVSTSLLTAFPAAIQDSKVEIVDFSLDYSQGSTIAQVRGTYKILDEDSSGRQVWIAGVGYNQGNPVAIRKWISPPDLNQADIYPFDFYLYSLGPEIDSVELLAELH